MHDRRSFLRNAALLGASATFATMPAFSAFAQEAMRLYWWGTPNRAERTLGVVELFETANPGVSLVGEVGGNEYWSKLTTMIAGGNAPDIFQLEPTRFADYSRRATNLPLNEYLGKAIRTDKLMPGVLDLGTVDGKVTGIPMSLNAFAMLYNPEPFSQAGLTPPSAETTWDEYARLCNDLTKAMGRKNIWASGNCSRYIFVFQAFLEQRGKQLFTDGGKPGFAATDVEDWFGYWESLAKNGGCVPAEILALDKVTVDSNPLATGNAVIAMAFSNQLQAFQGIVKSPLDITSLPVAKAGGPSGLFYRPGMHWSIASTSRNPELAARFIDFFVNDVEAGKILQVERGVPVNSEVQAAVSPTIDTVAKKAVDYIKAIEGRVVAYPPPVPLGAPEFDDRGFRPVADKVAFGQLTPKQAASEVMAAADRILKS